MTYPSVDLALVATHDSLDVVVHDIGQGSRVGDGRNPCWKLGVPDQSMTTNLEVVRSGKVDKSVSTGEGELALSRFSGVPLHTVLWCDLAKVGLSNGCTLGHAEAVRVGACSPVELALCLECCVQAGRSSGVKHWNGIDKACNGRKKQKRGTHGRG